MQLPRNGSSKVYDYQGAYLGYYFGRLGDTSRAIAELNKSVKEFPETSPYHLAWVYIALKNYKGALLLLNKAYDLRDIRLYFVKVDPALNPIRNEPGYKELLKKMNLE